MKIIDLEGNQRLQDAVLSSYHASSHTFAHAPQVTKIVENHLGKSFIEQVAAPALHFPFPIPLQPVPADQVPKKAV